MPPARRRLSAALAAAVLLLPLAAGCEQDGAEPSTTIEGAEDPAVPPEDDAAPQPSPDADTIPDAGGEEADD